jgi:hypothetical protein
MPSAKQDVLFILSWFRGAFSNPSFKLFSSFIVGFIRLGKEGHTSSMVQSLSRSFLSRSFSSFTRFLGKNSWDMDEVLATVLHKFFHTLKIKARSVVFLLLDGTIIQKTGEKIPGCGWYKDHAQNLANVFTLIPLKILQWVEDKKISLDLSIRTLALHVRRQILIERITVKLNNRKIQFKQNILDSFLEQLCA